MVAEWALIALVNALLESARPEYLDEVRAVLEPQLRDANGTWVADYVRLRFAATKAPPLG